MIGTRPSVLPSSSKRVFEQRRGRLFVRVLACVVLGLGGVQVQLAGQVAQRAGVSPEVRVVQLRQAERGRSGDGEPSGRHWQHKWIVKMHKVRQWYPSEQRHKVIYRGPYVKGPDDKPLLGGETVRGLVR